MNEHKFQCRFTVYNIIVFKIVVSYNCVYDMWYIIFMYLIFIFSTKKKLNLFSVNRSISCCLEHNDYFLLIHSFVHEDKLAWRLLFKPDTERLQTKLQINVFDSVCFFIERQIPIWSSSGSHVIIAEIAFIKC